MKYRYLGNSGLAVSTVCLGTMTFGQKEWGCDEKTSHEILNAFVTEGGNFIDTANQYNNGVTEQIIGNWLINQDREKLVIATKCAFQTDANNINSRGLSRKNIIQSCEDSLKRLRTDYIDLYQVYGFDPQTPLEETISALDYLVKQGKVRYIGCSNLPAWKIMKASCISDKKNYDKFISGQYLYNLLKRDIESEVIPVCDDLSIGVVCWSPLSGGMLTGKYIDPENPPKDTRIGLRPDLSEKRYKVWYENSVKVVTKLKEIAERNEQTISTVALSWILKNKNVSSVVVGARKVEQIIENSKAGAWLISDEEYSQLNELSQAVKTHPTVWCDENSQKWLQNIL